jgi:hypothetical protein
VTKEVEKVGWSLCRVLFLAMTKEAEDNEEVKDDAEDKPKAEEVEGEETTGKAKKVKDTKTEKNTTRQSLFGLAILMT